MIIWRLYVDGDGVSPADHIAYVGFAIYLRLIGSTDTGWGCRFRWLASAIKGIVGSTLGSALEKRLLREDNYL